MKKLWIIGSGAHAHVIGECAVLLNYKPIYIRSSNETDMNEDEYISEDEFLSQNKTFHPELKIICGVGSVKNLLSRVSVMDKYKHLADCFVSIIHPSAVIALEVLVGKGVFIAAGAVVSRKVSLGDHCIVNTGAVIDHDSTLATHCHVATGATLAGGVQCQENVHIGCGAIVIQGIQIARDTVLGAGTVCIRNIDSPGLTWVGNPARNLKTS
jgi:sugar O-acyltransferase (sialic acid O-acetyltransferase NeuD family)